jgi:hypothetical protein
MRPAPRRLPLSFSGVGISRRSGSPDLGSGPSLEGGKPARYKPPSRRMLPSSSGQDAALSRPKPGFDSPWERHPCCASDKFGLCPKKLDRPKRRWESRGRGPSGEVERGPREAEVTRSDRVGCSVSGNRQLACDLIQRWPHVVQTRRFSLIPARKFSSG